MNSRDDLIKYLSSLPEDIEIFVTEKDGEERPLHIHEVFGNVQYLDLENNPFAISKRKVLSFGDTDHGYQFD